jgi:hypothetical protein
MSMYRLRDLIKKEYYLLVSRNGGSIVMTPGNSTYLLVPREIREDLKQKFGIDFKHKENMQVRCDLVVEREGTINLIYSFWLKEEKPEEVKVNV